MPERMSNKEFNRIIDLGHDGGDLESLKPEAKRAREAEEDLREMIKYLKKTLWEMNHNLCELEKENAELKEKLAKWMPGKDGQALWAEMREKEPT